MLHRYRLALRNRPGIASRFVKRRAWVAGAESSTPRLRGCRGVEDSAPATPGLLRFRDVIPGLFLAVALSLTVHLCSSRVQAQIPHPRLQSVIPAGYTAGNSVDITVAGGDLEGVNALWFDHPGLRAFHLKGLTFRVAIAPGTPIGQHDVRALGPLGVSNPRVFVVSDRPELRETEPNNLPAQANSIALNTVVNGEISATDIDCFAFEGRKEERVFVELWAARIDSRLDAIVRVYGPDGRELAEREGGAGPDPFLDLKLPADGRYTVKVHDVIYAGSTDHFYRLMVHDGPHLDTVLPRAAPS